MSSPERASLWWAATWAWRAWWGQDDGEYGRYLWLYTPWNDGSGEAHVFAKASCYDMEEVTEASK